MHRPGLTSARVLPLSDLLWTMGFLVSSPCHVALGQNLGTDTFCSRCFIPWGKCYPLRLTWAFTGFSCLNYTCYEAEEEGEFMTSEECGVQPEGSSSGPWAVCGHPRGRCSHSGFSFEARYFLMNTCPQGLLAHLQRRLLFVGSEEGLFSAALEEMSSFKAYLPPCYLLGLRGLSAHEWKVYWTQPSIWSCVKFSLKLSVSWVWWPHL